MAEKLQASGDISLIATDMDGTLTQGGKFTPALLQAFADLTAVNIKIIVTTGRSAGWVSGLAAYLPIDGAIAENGGLYYHNGEQLPVLLSSITDLTSHRQQLKGIFQKLQLEFPSIQESADNRFRLTDWTFDVKPLRVEELQQLGQLCIQLGWGFTYSNVQCHIKPLSQDKAAGLIQVLRDYFPQFSLEQVVTVGDSPNDESLFNPSYFKHSVGVANVRDYANQMQHQPTYITNAAEGEGFCELVAYLVKNKLTYLNQ
ncbi:HAD family hydrolase [Synechocystis sp. PCC 7509]|uniref:HAD family hydrolase n=1 Tax=Synechocystis sp. PCC 7509 TaxID=927677 RepID=UPI0002ABE17F|nr:HAD family hydrolase [Synechocystis sp. PCC 7509]